MAKRVLFKKAVGGWGCPGRVMLNYTDNPIRDLEVIAESYRTLANERIEVLKNTGRQRLSPYEYFEAYPIVFLYRHAFELSLKTIVLAGGVALRDAGKEPMPIKKVMNHALTPLFEEVCRVWAVFTDDPDEPWKYELPDLNGRGDFEALVREFDEIDRQSDTFRYSIQKDGETASLEEVGFEFDLFAFAECMEFILSKLAGGPEWIREQMQYRWEAAYEAQQEESATWGPESYE